jgi:hypothetical protein
MGCGMSTASGRRAYKRVHSKTKEYDIFIETLPRRVEVGNPSHAQYPLGPANHDFRWPTNRHGIPSELSGRDYKKRMYASSKKARKAFVVRRVTHHDRNHELGMQVERDAEGNPIEGAVGVPMGSKYLGRQAGWSPYKSAFGAVFRGGRFFDLVPKDEEEVAPEGGGGGGQRPQQEE